MQQYKFLSPEPLHSHRKSNKAARMSLQSAPDIPLLVTVPSQQPTQSNPHPSPFLSAERRISPSWSISVLKFKLEPITGIPPSSQQLSLLNLDGTWTVVSGNEEQEIGSYGLRRGGELQVLDTRPAGMRADYYASPEDAGVEKYTMPAAQYEGLTDSVLHWKRTQGLGRFDPTKKPVGEVERERRTRDEEEVRSRGIVVGKRCRVGKEDERRGVVGFVGEVDGLGGEGGRGATWVGIVLDEPVGRNDGSLIVKVREEGAEKEIEKKVRLFECKAGFGVVVRPEKVEVGDEWTPLDDLGLQDENMDEI